MPTDPKMARKQGGTDTQRRTAWVASIVARQQVIHYETDNTCAPTTSTSMGITAQREDDSNGMPESVPPSDDEDGDDNLSAAKKLKESATVFIKEVIDSAATSVLANEPDLISSPAKNNEPATRGTNESKQAGKARPKSETASGSPANNKAAKASATETQKGSSMEDITIGVTNAPSFSVRTQVRVELYKPTSRSVNMAPAEINAKGKPYAFKGQEGATTTRAGTELEGARRSTTSQGKQVEVHYLTYVDDIVVGRARSRSETATPPTPA
jgi:hypothetical protein